MSFFNRLSLAGAAAAGAFLPNLAFAAQPVPKEMSFQPAATEIMERIHGMHDLLLVIITAICLVVLALLLIVIVRFNAKSNPVPSKTTHNTLLEVVWTVIPVIILAVIAVPSIKLLRFEAQIPKPDMVLKITGNQWNWTYTYPDHGDMEFTAIALKDDEAAAKGLPRLLATDQEVVLPAGKNIKVLITASDVMHAWTIPAFGVKIDAVPGRNNETWFNVKKTGVYYGQCSELCGKDHGYMPIMVRVVTPAEYDIWVAKTKEQLAAGKAPVEFAALDISAARP
jgi:cytochrome c oxidase subunit II